MFVHYQLLNSCLACESGRLTPRPFENGNDASRIFINLEFQKLRAYLRLLGYYSCLTSFVCSWSIARSVYLLCNASINSSWLPHDHVRHVIVT